MAEAIEPQRRVDREEEKTAANKAAVEQQPSGNAHRRNREPRAVHTRASPGRWQVRIVPHELRVVRKMHEARQAIRQQQREQRAPQPAFHSTTSSYSMSCTMRPNEAELRLYRPPNFS